MWLALAGCGSDPDGDGLSNDREAELGTDPFNADSDGDGLDDLNEVATGLDPLNPDTDGDGLRDGTEYDLGLDPNNADSDGDGLLDRAEIALRTDPSSRDTDRDGIDDNDEVKASTDPRLPDTDGDGVLDGDELVAGTDPLERDTDQDMLRDGDEQGRATDPLDDDSDDDGFIDGSEVLAGSDPLDPFDWDYDGGVWPDRSALGGPTPPDAGWSVGDPVADVELLDQRGQPLYLRQFAGYVIRIDVVIATDETSRTFPAGARDDWADHRRDGYLVMEVVVPPAGTAPGDVAAARNWARDFRLTFPVVDDAGAVVEGLRDAGLLQLDRPGTVLIDRDLRVRYAWAAGPGEDFPLLRDTLLAEP